MMVYWKWWYKKIAKVIRVWLMNMACHCYVLNPNKFVLIAFHANNCMYILFRTLELLQLQANGPWNWFFQILRPFQFQPIKKHFDCTLISNFIVRKNKIKSVFVKFHICFGMSTTFIWVRRGGPRIGNNPIKIFAFFFGKFIFAIVSGSWLLSKVLLFGVRQVKPVRHTFPW